MSDGDDGWGEPIKQAMQSKDRRYEPPILIPTPPPWVLRCAICLHKPPGDRDITKASPALTVLDGIAVCEEHVEWVPLGDEIEESLLEERNR